MFVKESQYTVNVSKTGTTFTAIILKTPKPYLPGISKETLHSETFQVTSLSTDEPHPEPDAE